MIHIVNNKISLIVVITEVPDTIIIIGLITVLIRQDLSISLAVVFSYENNDVRLIIIFCNVYRTGGNRNGKDQNSRQKPAGKAFSH
ncbi:hypothetical protein CSA37_03555 [Candidatus Fermentibacteria bacterium]|nr:MAG: hypothetical protein CSA37_03555 [Candidatus Fermentibacteria bacterium]